MRFGVSSAQSSRAAVVLLFMASFMLLFLLNGCQGCLVEAPVTGDQIRGAGDLLVQSMQLLNQRSFTTTEKVKSGYDGLGEFLGENNFTPPRVREMEQRHSDMLKSANDFRASLQDTKRKADSFFKLLDKRAQQSTPASSKLEIENQAAQRKNEFNLALDTTANALQLLDGFIKQYDDIVVPMREHTGSQVLDGYKAQVSKTSTAIAQLGQNLRAAVDQGTKIASLSSNPATLVAETPPAPVSAVAPALLPVAPVAATPVTATPAVPSPASPPRPAHVKKPSSQSTSPVSPIVPDQTDTVLVTLPNGTPIMARLTAPIPFGPYPEKEFAATLATALSVNGMLIAPQGTAIRGRVTEAESAPGSSDYQMRLVLTELALPDDKRVSVSTQLLVTNNTAGNVLASGAVFRFPLARPVALTLAKVP